MARTTRRSTIGSVITSLLLLFSISGQVRLAHALTWSRSAASMQQARQGHTATRLLDGRVLVTGGRDDTGAFLASAEVYNPIKDTWTAVPNMKAARYFHTATLLID